MRSFSPRGSAGPSVVAIDAVPTPDSPGPVGLDVLIRAHEDELLRELRGARERGPLPRLPGEP